MLHPKMYRVVRKKLYNGIPNVIMDDEYGAIGGMRIERENLSIRRKLAPAQLRPPQIQHLMLNTETCG
jgi:hypothetical protein